MFLIRKIGAALRGRATPLQVMLATLLGGLLGFVPGSFLPGDVVGGLAQGPGLILVLVCLVLVANANLAVFAVVSLLAKVLGLLLLPMSYRVGVWLLEGPLSGLFGALIDGKVTAWFGLEYYATTGGLVLGTVFGVLCGVLLNRAIAAIRRRMAAVEENNETYQRFAKRWWVRLSTWLLLGKGKGKKSWQELAESQKKGLPIRIGGVIAAAVLVGSAVVFQSWFSAPILTRGVQSSLQALNGATVDLGRAELQLGGGSLRIEGLAIADRNALDRDLLAADVLVATIDTGELLRKRLVIDELRSDSARANSKRGTPGVLLPSDEPAVVPEPEPAPTGQQTIDDYLQEFEVWRQRLEQAADWLEGITGGDEPVREPTPEDIERQRQEQEQLGLANVRALHLLREEPRVVVRRIDIEGIGFSIGGKDDAFDLRLRNLSDAPSLLADVASMSLGTRSESLQLQLTGPVGGADAMSFDFAAKGLPVDSLFSQLKIGGQPALRGGTIDFGGNGKLSGLASSLHVDLPLDVQIRGATLALGSQPPTRIELLKLPVGLSGSWTDPAVSLGDQALQQALLEAGQKELANYVQAQAGKLLGGALPIDLNQAPDKLVEDAQKKAEAEAKKAADDAAAAARKKLEDEAKKRLPGGLNGLLPGGKKN